MAATSYSGSVSKWTPFGVALDLKVSITSVTRTSATEFTVRITASWETYYSGAATKYGMRARSSNSSVTISNFDGTSRSSGSASFTAKFSISGNGASTKTIGVVFENYNTDNADSKTTTVSVSGVSVPAWTSYTITYNANGGSGAPGNQTKWKDQTLTLSSTKPTRTGYSFLGWSTSSTATTATYSAGGSYTANSAATLYAVWKANTYTVKYDANGGSGAPGNQTKTYGVTLKLSSTIPTRTNYNFKGWGTSASATTVSYAAGGNYTANAAVTLYAIWELAYVKPRITNLSVVRGSWDGDEIEDGTYALVDFDFECDLNWTSIVIEWESETTDPASMTWTGSPNTSGHICAIVGDGALNTETTYTIRVIVTDANGYSYAFGTLSSTKFVIDFMTGGKGAAFNKSAELEGVLDIGFKTRFFGGILYPVLDPETDLNDIKTPNTYIGANVADYAYVNCPVSSGTFTLIVESGGAEGQVRQTYISCSKYKPERYVRFYYQEAWGEWFWAGTEEYVLYENSNGSADTITLNASVANYRYIEIYYTDNNNKGQGYTKIWNANNKVAHLQLQEAGSNPYFRQTAYSIVGTSITPEVATASYVRVSTAGAVTTSIGTNYIKIVRVIGRA